MIIKKLVLNNFRQYMGKNEISFSSGSKKNVTIILSKENGAGKTTLLEAFNWCFYRNLNLPNSDEILTGTVVRELKNGEEEAAYVEVHITNKGKNYVINRKNIYKKIDDRLVRENRDFSIQLKNKNGILENLDNSEIENIIPEDLSMYFFFDGERIENLSQENRKGKKDISDAVKNILGLDILLDAQKHLDKILKSYDKEYDDSNSKKMKEYKSDLETQEKKDKRLKVELEALEDEKEAMEELQKKYKKQLEGFEKAKNLQGEREHLEQLIKSSEKHIENQYKEIKEKNKSTFADYITSKTLDVYVDKFNMEEFEDKGLIGIDGKAIDQLIERGVCLCGHSIVKESTEYYKLKEQKNYQPPASLAVIVNQFNEKISDCKNNSEEFKEDIKEINKRIEKNYDDIDNHRKEIKRINDEISNKGGNIESIEAKRKEVAEDLKINHDQITDLIVKIKETDSNISSIKGELDKLAQSNEKNRKIYIKKLYTNEVLEKIENYYNKKENEILENLNKKVTEVFSKLIETNHKININDDYTFSVIDEDGIESTSTGQNIITTLGFIGGIIKLAREGHDDIEVSEQYPLILDAPLSDLSSNHKKNVAEVLPNIAEQLIIFTLDKDYYSDFEEIIQSKVGKIYKLKMNQDGSKRTTIERCENVS